MSTNSLNASLNSMNPGDLVLLQRRVNQRLQTLGYQRNDDTENPTTTNAINTDTIMDAKEKHRLHKHVASTRRIAKLSPKEQLQYFEAIGEQLHKQGLVEDFTYKTTYDTDEDMVVDNNEEMDVINSNKEESCDFIQPRQSAKRRKPDNKPEEINMTNKYSVLDEENITIQEEPVSNNNLSKDEDCRPPQVKSPIAPKKEKGITPIIVRDNNKWSSLSKQLYNRKINYTKAKLNAKKEIEVTPASEEDYRQMYKVLKETNTQFYTYQLRSEKPLKVVLRGIPIEIEEEEVLEDLKNKNYPATKVVRMKGKYGPAPLVLVEIHRDYKSIYSITNCCGLHIEVEPLRKKDTVTICHRCQAYGHVQKNCNNEYKCMKCGESHSTHLCEKPKTKPAKCANCGGEHLSISLRCPSNPNNPSNKKKEPENKNPWFNRKTEQNTTTATPADNEKELYTTLGEMLADLTRHNANEELKLKFIEKTEKIISLFKQK